MQLKLKGCKAGKVVFIGELSTVFKIFFIWSVD